MDPWSSSSHLERLPDDLLGAVLVRLSAAEAATAALASKRLREAASDHERVWRPLCLRAFAPAAAASRGRALGAWRRLPCRSRGGGGGGGAGGDNSNSGKRPPLPRPPPTRPEPPPPSPHPPLLPWRDTFRLLLRHAPLVGLWSGAGAGPRGVLVAARWGDGCVKVDQLLGGAEAVLAARLRRELGRAGGRPRRALAGRGGGGGGRGARSGSSTASGSLDGGGGGGAGGGLVEGDDEWLSRRQRDDDEDEEEEEEEEDEEDDDEDGADDEEDDEDAGALVDALLLGDGGGGPAHGGRGSAVPPLLARRLCRVGPSARPRPTPGGGSIWWDFELEGGGGGAGGGGGFGGGGGGGQGPSPVGSSGDGAGSADAGGQSTMLWFGRRSDGGGSALGVGAGERLRLSLREYFVPPEAAAAAAPGAAWAGSLSAAAAAGTWPGSSGGGGGGGGGSYNNHSLASAAAAAAGVWQPPEGSGGGAAAAGGSPAGAGAAAAAPPLPPAAAAAASGFGASFTAFMATNVLGRSSSASRARFGTSPDAHGGAGGSSMSPGARPFAAADAPSSSSAAPWRGAGPPPAARLRAAHRFSAVASPAPSRRCPLAGVYRAAYGPHGLEAQSVAYDFSGARPRLVARKLLGDPNVPAGEATWWAAVHEPLPLGEGAVERRRVVRRGYAVAEAGAGVGIGAGVAGASPAAPPRARPAAAATAATTATTTTTATATASESGRRRAVVAAFRGQGRIADAGFANPRWLDGRLWLFEDGALAFVWLLDADEAAALGGGGAPDDGEAEDDADDLGGPDGSWWLTEYARLGPAELGKGIEHAALRGVGLGAWGTGGGGGASNGGGGGSEGPVFASPLRMRAGA